MTVRPPRPAIKDLIKQVQALVPPLTQAGQLISPLELAASRVEKGQIAQACAEMQTFVNRVNALGRAQAQSLLDYANKIRAASGCPNPARAETVALLNAAGGAFQFQDQLMAEPAAWIAQYSQAGGVPVAGDWDGDGVTTIGLYGPGGEVLLRNTNTAGLPEIILTSGLTGGLPVVGRWQP